MFLFDTADCLAGMAAVTALLSCHVEQYANAAQTTNDDPRVRTERAAIDTDWGKIDCYLARPANTGPHPGVIVVRTSWV
ncbi:hypothetical protein [Rhizobium grahamii]|uniref:Uncharacterized protein n=1 Tax=Rhizobium grahamii CCGE 502 TaxID=990285 RepID=S3IC36_9HYPH|nr:hypothetical protein [Rhizobium grahamii]EPE96783.1 hypothetical protein RGCCGE502_19185 [Rhizobium grahamii CCGE 502]